MFLCFHIPAQLWMRLLLRLRLIRHWGRIQYGSSRILTRDSISLAFSSCASFSIFSISSIFSTSTPPTLLADTAQWWLPHLLRKHLNPCRSEEIFKNKGITAINMIVSSAGRYWWAGRSLIRELQRCCSTSTSPPSTQCGSKLAVWLWFWAVCLRVSASVNVSFYWFKRLQPAVLEPRAALLSACRDVCNFNQQKQQINIA